MVYNVEEKQRDRWPELARKERAKMPRSLLKGIAWVAVIIWPFIGAATVAAVWFQPEGDEVVRVTTILRDYWSPESNNPAVIYLDLFLIAAILAILSGWAFSTYNRRQ